MVFCVLYVIMLLLNNLFKFTIHDKILNVQFFLCISGTDRTRARCTSALQAAAHQKMRPKIYSPVSCYMQMNIVHADVPLASCTLNEKTSVMFTEFSELQAFF